MGKQGKEECWLVVAADPGATLGIGFREEIGEEAMRAAALDGSIEDLMVWHAVKPGDFFYIPANTVHAIGAGVTVIEVQQNSDITYRLFDYGRPRELHLEEGIAVAKGEVYAETWRKTVPAQGTMQLVDGPLFRLDQVSGVPDAALMARYPGAVLVIPREGSLTVAGQDVAPGGCALAMALGEVQFAREGTCLLATSCAP
ncbi:class I mannose-6-phosphate isomerase [Novosphingobium colocasiae]